MSDMERIDYESAIDELISQHAPSADEPWELREAVHGMIHNAARAQREACRDSFDTESDPLSPRAVRRMILTTPLVTESEAKDGD